MAANDLEMGLDQVHVALASLRHASGRTLNDVASASGMAPSSLASIERGRATTPDTLTKIAAALGWELELRGVLTRSAADPQAQLPVTPTLSPEAERTSGDSDE